MTHKYEDLPEHQRRIFDNLSEEEKKVLIIMRPGLSFYEIAEMSGISPDELESILEGMENKGIIRSKGF